LRHGGRDECVGSCLVVEDGTPARSRAGQGHAVAGRVAAERVLPLVGFCPALRVVVGGFIRVKALPSRSHGVPVAFKVPR